MASCDVEAELVAALFAGPSETPLWSTFLNGLRRAARADSANLIFNPLGRHWKESLNLVSSGSTAGDMERDLERMPAPGAATLSHTSIEGRPYTIEELAASNDPNFFSESVAARGITDIRHMRVREATGVHAWLTLARAGGRFDDRAGKLMSAIAPVLRGVLRLYVAMERERYGASLTAEAVRRLQFGWITLDHTGRVLDYDEQAALVLSNSGVLRRSSAGRLATTPPELEREILQALALVTGSPQSRPRALTLSREPWLEMLLTPARNKSITAEPAPAAIAYVHGDSWRHIDRGEQLAELFALSPREARMALALSRGMTIAEAASEFGLTIGSARMYTKLIYAKTGARGLPDLVRIVMRSVLAIGPEK